VTCGDNVREGSEVCDGTDLGGQTCQTVGSFSGGTLACNGSCTGWDTAGCISGGCAGDGEACVVDEDCCEGQFLSQCSFNACVIF
jgi:hypothetical protein